MLLLPWFGEKKIYKDICNPLGNLNSGRSPWAKLIRKVKGKGKGKCIAVCINTYTATGNHATGNQAPHCSSYSMRLSLNYFCVLFTVAFMWRFVFFSTIRLKWLVQCECVVMWWQNVYRQSPDGDREIFLKYYVGCFFRILDKLHIFSNIWCTCSIFIKIWAQI